MPFKQIVIDMYSLEMEIQIFFVNSRIDRSCVPDNQIGANMVS